MAHALSCQSEVILACLDAVMVYLEFVLPNACMQLCDSQSHRQWHVHVINAEGCCFTWLLLAKDALPI